VVVAAGAVTSLQGVASGPFATTFTVDPTPPRIVATSLNGAPLAAAKVLPAAPLTFSATFDEPIRAVGTEDVILVNTTTGAALSPILTTYDAPSRTWTAQFPALGEGIHVLTLVSAADAFADAAGNPLDGEPLGPNPDGTPTGNGLPGGNYSLQFTADAPPDTLDGRWQPLAPLGSLVWKANQSGGVSYVGDADAFDFYLDAGQALAASVLPSGNLAVLTLALRAPNGEILASDTADAPGQIAFVDGVPAATAGRYRAEVSGGALGDSYNVSVLRNAVIERTDSTAAAPMSLGGSATTVAPVRRAVVGTSGVFTLPPTELVPRGAVWKYKDDIANGSPYPQDAQGDLWNEGDYDDSAWLSGPAILGYGNLDIGPWTTQLSYGPDAGNKRITYLFRRTFNVTQAAAMASLSLELLVDDGASIYVNGREILRHQLSGTLGGPAPGTNALATTDGAEGTYLPFNISLASFPGLLAEGVNTVAVEVHQQSLSSGDIGLDLRIVGNYSAAPLDADYFTLDLSGKVGVELDVVLSGLDGNDFGTQTLELLSPGGAVAAAASAAPLGVNAGNYDLAILGYVVPAGGLYTVRFTSQQSGDYAILVTENVRFDSEPNGSIATDSLRSLNGVGAALGSLDAGDIRDLYRFTVPAGETLHLRTYTPQDGAGSNNRLNPRLVLYSASGAFLAVDANSGDGKNARLDYFSASGGVYVISVESDLNAGDYRLTASSSLSAGTLLDVLVGSTEWSTPFHNALAARGLGGGGGYSILPNPGDPNEQTPWTNLNQVSLVFDRPVAVNPSDLTLRGVHSPTYPASAFSNVGTVATWTFSQFLPHDRLRLDISAALEALLGSGPLDVAFDSLPGDVTRDGQVTVADMIEVRQRAFTWSAHAEYDPRYDLGGDGYITALDMVQSRNRQGTSLPSGAPSPAAASPAAASLESEPVEVARPMVVHADVTPAAPLVVRRAIRPADADAALGAWDDAGHAGGPPSAAAARLRARRASPRPILPEPLVH
jgi:hypothetical protein